MLLLFQCILQMLECHFIFQNILVFIFYFFIFIYFFHYFYLFFFTLSHFIENILNWISNSWKDFHFPTLYQKCQETLKKSLLYDVYLQVPSHEPSILSNDQNSSFHPYYNPTTLAEMPNELLLYILSYLDATSLALLSCCNKFFQQSTKLIIPGLNLKLFPHQETSGNSLFIVYSVLSISNILY